MRKENVLILVEFVGVGSPNPLGKGTLAPTITDTPHINVNTG